MRCLRAIIAQSKGDVRACGQNTSRRSTKSGNSRLANSQQLYLYVFYRHSIVKHVPPVSSLSLLSTLDARRSTFDAQRSSTRGEECGRPLPLEGALSLHALHLLWGSGYIVTLLLLYLNEHKVSWLTCAVYYYMHRDLQDMLMIYLYRQIYLLFPLLNLRYFATDYK